MSWIMLSENNQSLYQCKFIQNFIYVIAALIFDSPVGTLRFTFSTVLPVVLEYRVSDYCTCSCSSTIPVACRTRTWHVASREH